MKKKFYRVNLQITASNLRVIDDQGNQVGILSFPNALKLAKEKGLDLVEIAPQAVPPVAKLTNFKRFLFEKEKKEHKRVKEIETKEIRVGPFISDHDLQTRLGQARKFVTSGNNVKLTIQFTPREMRHPEFGEKIVTKVKESLSGIAEIARQSKWEGRRFTTIFTKSSHAKSQN